VGRIQTRANGWDINEKKEFFSSDFCEAESLYGRGQNRIQKVLACRGLFPLEVCPG